MNATVAAMAPAAISTINNPRRSSAPRHVTNSAAVPQADATSIAHALAPASNSNSNAAITTAGTLLLHSFNQNPPLRDRPDTPTQRPKLIYNRRSR